MREDIDLNDNFILIPAASGGGALVRRSQIAGGRANGADGAIVYGFRPSGRRLCQRI